MTRATAFGLAVAMASVSGCVAPEVCTERLSEGSSSSILSGEQTFSQTGDEGRVHFRAMVRGLSELWPAEHVVQGAGLTVVLHLDYVDAGETGGVATEMPRFGVNLASAASPSTSYAYSTPAFPPSTGVQYYLPLFGECYDAGDVNCCEYGSTECSLDVLLRYVRQEGEPFPPVVVRWEASLYAGIDTCPLAENAEVTLEVEAP